MQLISRLSLKKQMFLLFSLIFLLFFVLYAGVTQTHFETLLSRQITQDTTTLVGEAKLNIDSYFSNLRVGLEVTACNRRLLSAVKKYYSGQYIHTDMVDAIWETNSLMGDTLTFYPNIKDLCLIDREGLIINKVGNSTYTNMHYNFLDQAWFPQDMGSLLVTRFIGPHPQDYYFPQERFSQKDAVISAIIPVVDVLDYTQEQYGYLLCNVDSAQIDSLLNKTWLGQSGLFLILDAGGTVVNTPRGGAAGSGLAQRVYQQCIGDAGSFSLREGEHDYVSVYSTSEVTGWTLVAMVPMNEMLQPLYGTRSLILLFVGVCIALVLCSSVVISSSITGPIVRLMQKMALIEQGDFTLKLYDASSRELAALSGRIDLMIQRVNTLNHDLYTWQIKSKESQMKALQAKINPHFLYNSLNAIKAAALCGRPQDVSKMTGSLGALFRYATFLPDEMVTIAEELEHLREYILMQEYRFPGRYTCTVRCAPHLLGHRIVKLVFQPLVENVYIHGFAGGTGSQIEVAVAQQGPDLLIAIRDDGVGISPAQQQRLHACLASEAETAGTGSIGLKNVHDRIRLKCGPAYGLTVTSVPSGGTTIEMLIPTIL